MILKDNFSHICIIKINKMLEIYFNKIVLKYFITMVLCCLQTMCMFNVSLNIVNKCFKNRLI